MSCNFPTLSPLNGDAGGGGGGGGGGGDGGIDAGSGSATTCSNDNNCMDVSGKPHCNPSGVCVQCTTSDECSAGTPVCDQTSDSCRGCVADTECATSVCILDSGACAAASDIAYVEESGTDTGTCPKSAPCFTIPYAIAQLTGVTPKIVHIIGGTYSVEAEVDLEEFSGTIDGENTQIQNFGSGTAVFVLDDTDTVTFSNLQFLGTIAGVVAPEGNSTFEDVDIKSEVSGGTGTTTLENSSLEGTLIDDGFGMLNIKGSKISGIVNTRDPTILVTGSLFQGGELSMVGSTATIENNVFELGSGIYTAAIKVSGASIVQFNTFVNSTGTTPTEAAVSGGGTATCDSNIVAWNSATPLQSCASITYSLFDSPAAVPAGSGNFSGSTSAFFTNLAGSDFHLASGSPAKGEADPAATLTTDYDGNPRPNPSGSTADIGAFEAP